MQEHIPACLHRIASVPKIKHGRMWSEGSEDDYRLLPLLHSPRAAWHMLSTSKTRARYQTGKDQVSYSLLHLRDYVRLPVHSRSHFISAVILPIYHLAEQQSMYLWDGLVYRLQIQAHPSLWHTTPCKSKHFWLAARHSTAGRYSMQDWPSIGSCLHTSILMQSNHDISVQAFKWHPISFDCTAVLHSYAVSKLLSDRFVGLWSQDNKIVAVVWTGI